MATTYEKIATVTVGSGGAANITFSSIPQTYTDLVIKVSARDDRSGSNYTDDFLVTFNGDSTSSYAYKILYGGGGSAGSFGSGADSQIFGGYLVGTDGTANTFGNTEIYIPNYAGSTYKSTSYDGVAESNSSSGVYVSLGAGLWSKTAAITSIKLDPFYGNTLLQYSSATLYGIKNS